MQLKTVSTHRFITFKMRKNFNQPYSRALLIGLCVIARRYIIGSLKTLTYKYSFSLLGSIFLGLLFAAPAAAAVDDAYFRSVYTVNPIDLTDDQQKEKSAELDKIWSGVKANPDELLPLLRRELASTDMQPFFYYDGGKLLMSLSKTPEDTRLVLSAFLKVNLDQIQHTDYLRTVHWLAVQGYDTTDAALNVLNFPKFKAFIPQHYLTLGQDYSFLYMVVPLSEELYLDSLVARLTQETDETAVRSLLLTIWYTVTKKGNAALDTYAKNPKHPEGLRAYAAELLARKDKLGPTFSFSSFAELKAERRKAMRRISDEALIELDEYTRKILGKSSF